MGLKSISSRKVSILGLVEAELSCRPTGSHHMRLVTRDIKPRNCLFTALSQRTLLDDEPMSSIDQHWGRHSDKVGCLLGMITLERA